MNQQGEVRQSNIPFHVPTHVSSEPNYVLECLGADEDIRFQKACSSFLKANLGVPYVELTSSCTHALELAALALDVQSGDQVVVPSFTFTSTANAFLLRGATVSFADIDPETLNLDPESLKQCVSSRTKVVVVVHYAGIACDMDPIVQAASNVGAAVVEDAAHALFGKYKGRPLGTIGDIGAFSFHRTKNFSCGEGGAFACNSDELAEIAEVIREKGTNRSQFMRGNVEKYEWIHEGSSYVIADMLAAQLLAQLEQFELVQSKRERAWRFYHDALRDWAETNGVRQPSLPEFCDPAWHLYYMIMPTTEARDRLLSYLRAHGIGASFHYLPLHLTPMGRQLGGMVGDAPVTEWAADRLIRLPFYTNMLQEDLLRVVECVHGFRC